MTVRLLKSWGLIAGMSMREAGCATPGEVVDLYVYRRNYDDEQHQLTRGTDLCYD
jgi:hypothetical protein